MSSNQFLVDAASRRSLFIQRYSAGLEKEAAKVLADALRFISTMLDDVSLESLSSARFGALQLDINAEFGQRLNVLSTEVIQALGEFAQDEAEFTARMLENGTKAEVVRLTPQQIEMDFMTGRFGFDAQMNISQALDRFGKAKSTQVQQVLRDSYSDGKTSQQAIAAIRELIPLQTRQASSLVRTATNSASIAARMQSMAENSDLFDGYEWVSTLDNRTSHICMARDGKIYPFAANSPKPPAHWACRSTIIPKVKAEYDLLAGADGVRPSVGAKGAQEQSASTTYGGWLRKQPASFQNEALGETRAKLFRNGGLSIEAFSDPSGKTYTLDQLRSLHPMAFEKANI